MKLAVEAGRLEMALTRAKKTQKVEALAKELAGSTSAIVGTFSKLTVAQDYDLRQKVRGAGGRYRVLKNKLAARASKGTGIEGALQGLKGVSSVAYTSGDPVALAKALTAWVKDNSEFTFKLGIVDGKVITVEEVQSLATMPGKDEIFAKLLFLISAPAQRLVTVLNAAGRDMAVVLGQGVEKGKFAESRPVAAVAEAAPVRVAAAAPAPAAVPVPAAAPAPVETAEAPAPAEPHAPGPVEAAVTAETVAPVPVEAPAPAPAEPAATAETASPAPAETQAPAAVETAASASVEADAPAQPEALAVAPEAVTGPAISTPVASEVEAEVSPAPAPAEGPAAEGNAAETEPTQAEEAVDEPPVEG